MPHYRKKPVIEADNSMVKAFFCTETEKLLYGSSKIEHDIDNNVIKVHSPSGTKEFKYDSSEIVKKTIEAMAKYRKKPIVVEAWCVNKKNLVTMPQEFHNAMRKDINGIPYIPTLEGNMKVCLGDYIIKGVKGEFYPCKPDIFEDSYELVDGEEF